ncbi:hypothetical protein PPNSA23_47230 [Phyllobacterium phragmitis]|uniref:Uncharacterized protein n=1 Tax=Phyllobacterium phragmitis TaxID=2670329 RepID=A0ABQ0H781_9HYPH
MPLYELSEGKLLASSYAGEQRLVVEALRQTCNFRRTHLVHAGLPPVAAKAHADISTRVGVPLPLNGSRHADTERMEGEGVYRNEAISMTGNIRKPRKASSDHSLCKKTEAPCCATPSPRKTELWHCRTA